MDEVPPTTPSDGIDLRRNIVVTPWRPGANPNDTHSLAHFLFGKWSGMRMWDSCQECEIDSILHETASGLMNMRFQASHVGKVAWRHHQHHQRTCHQLCPFSFHIVIIISLSWIWFGCVRVLVVQRVLW